MHLYTTYYWWYTLLYALVIHLFIGWSLDAGEGLLIPGIRAVSIDLNFISNKCVPLMLGAPTALPLPCKMLIWWIVLTRVCLWGTETQLLAPPARLVWSASMIPDLLWPCHTYSYIALNATIEFTNMYLSVSVGGRHKCSYCLYT